MSSSNLPCAACKLLRRRCTQICVFAPHFPPDQPQKFVNVHKVFGASNVAKLLNELSANLREDAMNSLAYEAEARLRDPVYGCAGLISILQHRLKQVQIDLYNVKKELATYVGPQAMLPMLQAQAFMPQQHMGNPSSSSTVIQHGMLPMIGIPTGLSHGGQLMIHDPPHQHQHQHHHHQQQQIFDPQQLTAAIAAREQQEMIRNYEQQQQQQQQELVRFNSGFDASAVTVTPTGFNQMSGAAMSPSLALGSFDNPYQIQAQQQPEHDHHAPRCLPAQLLLQSQQGQALPPPPPPPQTEKQQNSGSKILKYLQSSHLYMMPLNPIELPAAPSFKSNKNVLKILSIRTTQSSQASVKNPNTQPINVVKLLRNLPAPIRDKINDQKTDCAVTVFSYINLYGKFPHGLFARKRHDVKEGLECKNIPPQQSNAAARQSTSLMLKAGILLLLHLML